MPSTFKNQEEYVKGSLTSQKLTQKIKDIKLEVGGLQKPMADALKMAMETITKKNKIIEELKKEISILKGDPA